MARSMWKVLYGEREEMMTLKGLNTTALPWGLLSRDDQEKIRKLRPGALVVPLHPTAWKKQQEPEAWRREWASDLWYLYQELDSPLIIYRICNQNILEEDPAEWAKLCAWAVEGMPPGHVVPANEFNIEAKKAEREDWDAQAAWLGTFGYAFKSYPCYEGKCNRPLHIPALSPTPNALAGYMAYKAAGLSELYDGWDFHVYSYADLEILSRMHEVMPDVPFYITEFDQMTPSTFLGKVAEEYPYVVAACYFTLNDPYPNDPKGNWQYALMNPDLKEYYDGFRALPAIVGAQEQSECDGKPTANAGEPSPEPPPTMDDQNYVGLHVTFHPYKVAWQVVINGVRQGVYPTLTEAEAIFNALMEALGRDRFPAPEPDPHLASPSLMKVGNMRAVDMRFSLQPRWWRKFRTLQDIKCIIIHHSASPDTSAWDIAEYHRKPVSEGGRGLDGIAYHFLVHPNGKLVGLTDKTGRGRSLIEYTADILQVRNHAGDVNRESIGICLDGNFMEQPPPKNQVRTTIKLIANLQFSLGWAVPMYPHWEFVDTDCPGLAWEAINKEWD